MTIFLTDAPASSLRQRMIEDMNIRRFTRKTQFDYVHHVARFTTFLGRPPDTATVEDLRQFEVEKREAGLGILTFNSIVSALRFFFTHTIDRPDLSRRHHMAKNPRALPVVLSRDEVVATAGSNQLPQAQGGAVGRIFEHGPMPAMRDQIPPRPPARTRTAGRGKRRRG